MRLLDLKLNGPNILVGIHCTVQHNMCQRETMYLECQSSRNEKCSHASGKCDGVVRCKRIWAEFGDIVAVFYWSVKATVQQYSFDLSILVVCLVVCFVMSFGEESGCLSLDRRLHSSIVLVPSM